MPEYLERRFNSRKLRAIISVTTLFQYVLTRISVDLYAGDVFLQEALGWNIYPSTISLLLVTGVYTITGGLAAVVYTEVLQTAVMVVGAFVLMATSFARVGGLSGLRDKWPGDNGYDNSSGTCDIGEVPHNAFHMFRSADDPNFPWPAVVFAVPLTGLYYWCSSQVMVQRVLSAKDKLHARAGTVLAGYLKVLPMFLIVLPGMISRVLYPRRVGCADRCDCKAICDNAEGCSNIAYPELVIKLLPSGATGLLLAVMMAALMSSLASTFNSAGTMFTMDVWKALRPKASEREQVYVGYCVVIIMVLISIAWLPILQALQGAELFIYIQALSNYIQPPLIVLFLTGIFWRRTTRAGAFAGLFVGLSIGLSRLLLELIYNLGLGEAPEKCKKDTRPRPVTVHYLYVGMFNFFVSLLATVLVSLLTKPLPVNQLAGITWPTRHKVVGVSTTDNEHSPIVRDVDINEEETEFISPAPTTQAVLAHQNGGDGKVMDDVVDLDEEVTRIECLGHLLSSKVTRWTLRCSVVCLLIILAAVWLVLR